MWEELLLSGRGSAYLNSEIWAETKRYGDQFLVLQNNLRIRDILLISVLHREETNKGSSQEHYFEPKIYQSLKKIKKSMVS